jgi:hypothetical protein
MPCFVPAVAHAKLVDRIGAVELAAFIRSTCSMGAG